MADKPKETLGRGGRGALLLAALQNQPRRPGQTSPTNEPPPPQTADVPSEPKVLGRGAFLQQLLSQGRGKPIVSPAPEPTPSAEPEIPKTFGRGRGLATLLSSDSGSSSKSSSASPPASSLTQVEEIKPSSLTQVEEIKPSPSPPVSELEELTIGKYSGTSGQNLPLEVNYIRLKVKEGTSGIYEYHVSFKPQVDSQQMKFRIMKDPAIKEIIGNVKTFDGAKMYIPQKLSSSVVNINAKMPTDDSLVTVTIKMIKKSSANDCIHLYNLLFKKVMIELKMTRMGRNFFDPKGGISVPQHRLEIWPGYVTAVQEFEGGIMLNCDASFRVLRTTTALNIFQEAFKKPNMREHVAKLLLGCVVLTRYNNKTYKVDDIAWNMNPTNTFTSHTGGEISFVEYYKKSYDITIKDLQQPLLINKEKKKATRAGEEDPEPKLICLIPELCFMTGLTDEMRDDFRVMKDVGAHTRLAPESRQLALKRFVKSVKSNPEAKAVFDRWNLELEDTPVSLEGRLLKSEVILFGRNVSVPANAEADWGRDVVNNPVLVPVHFEKWAIIYPQRDSNKCREFVKMLLQVTNRMGIEVSQPQHIEIKNDRTETYCDALKSVINPTLQFVCVIFPTPRDDRYSAVKKRCCIEMPIPSQCINLKTISDQRKLRSVVQKIALQINCKLGGELWSVHIPIGDLMVCGMDTYHDNSNGKKSVLAFVASINQNRTRWFSMTTIQNQGQEVGDSLKMLFIRALKKYFDVNHKLPEKIIMFRDGVGDGQIDFISKYEVEQLTSSFKHFQMDYSPSLSVVVVQKRINTRMFAKAGPMLKNPPPGSILDHSVTRKKWYDFFLVSQHVRQGTVSPTHYVVVYDDSTIKPEHMQRVTYKMTHLYYNWPGTVRVPAPCQYAHKLAYLVGQSLHKDTHDALSDRLFYL